MGGRWTVRLLLALALIVLTLIQLRATKAGDAGERAK